MAQDLTLAGLASRIGYTTQHLGLAGVLLGPEAAARASRDDWERMIAARALAACEARDAAGVAGLRDVLAA